MLRKVIDIDVLSKSVLIHPQNSKNLYNHAVGDFET